MATFVSPAGNLEIWDEKPKGYFTQEEWTAGHPISEASFGPGYKKHDGDWWKMFLSQKEFLLLCGFTRVTALNAAISSGNATAKTVYDFLTAAEYVDLREQNTVELIRLLASRESGPVWSEEEVERILRGEKHVAAETGAA